MGVVLTAVANGDVMSSSTQRTNITTVRDWINGGIVAGDIPSGALSSRHFRRMTHFAGANERSVGVTGSIWTHRISDDRVLRNYGISDAQGVGVWAPVANLTMQIYAPSSGSMEITSRGWYWPMGASNSTTPLMVPPEEYTACYIRLAYDGVAASVRRTLWDSGQDGDTVAYTVGAGTGAYIYGARNHVMLGSLSVAAGWHTVGVQVNVITQASVDRYGMTLFGAASLNVEYYAK